MPLSKSTKFAHVPSNEQTVDDLVVPCPHCGGRFRVSPAWSIAGCPECKRSLYARSCQGCEGVFIAQSAADALCPYCGKASSQEDLDNAEFRLVLGLEVASAEMATAPIPDFDFTC